MTTETHYATGRRKTSSARIYLSSGKGNIKVNDKDLDVYFGRKVAQMLVMQPLEMTELTDKVDINIKVKGGGSFGQAGAIRHGISRALISLLIFLFIPKRAAALLGLPSSTALVISFFLLIYS